MKKAAIRFVPVAALTALALAGAAALAPQGADSRTPGANKILAHKLAVELGQEPRRGKEMPVSSGVMYTLLEHKGVLAQRAAQNPRAMERLSHSRGISRPFTEGCQNVFHRQGKVNIRVNQDCSLRRQAEEAIQINPLDERNMVAGQNDSRIGFNHCGYDWTFNGGWTWGDQVPPFWQFQLLDGHTADACSDPTMAYDSRGNVYVGGIFFDVASNANAVAVMKSNNPNGGAFYHSPNPAGGFQEYRTLPVGVVANDLDDFNDKELMTADAWVSSPKRDNVYMTWTKFTADGHSPIDFSQSTDGGATWSTEIEISGATRRSAPCRQSVRATTTRAPTRCVGRDGTVYVAFANGNMPGAGQQQVLFVKCPAAANCSLPRAGRCRFRVGNQVSTHPVGPPSQTAVRTAVPAAEWLPGPGRVHCHGLGRPGQRAVRVVGRSPQQHERELPARCTARRRPARADHDVHYAFSTNGGSTWSATARSLHARVRRERRSGSRGVSHGGRQASTRSPTTTAPTATASPPAATTSPQPTIRNPTSTNPPIRYTRVTTGSMPNLMPANNPVQAGFLGDYMWVGHHTVAGDAHIVWADTRPIRGDAPEEDVYYAEVRRHGGGHCSLPTRFGERAALRAALLILLIEAPASESYICAPRRTGRREAEGGEIEETRRSFHTVCRAHGHHGRVGRRRCCDEQ